MDLKYILLKSLHNLAYSRIIFRKVIFAQIKTIT